MRSPRLRRIALAGSVGRPDRVPPADATRLIRAYAGAPGFAAVSGAMRSSRFERLAEIEVPVTLAWPEYDRLIARPRRLPPNARSVDLPGCGHVPMWDDPQQVAEVILAGTRRAGAPAHR
jgi:pimeloyl-ACP methyl ester carboxylesterase